MCSESELNAKFSFVANKFDVPVESPLFILPHTYHIFSFDEDIKLFMVVSLK